MLRRCGRLRPSATGANGGGAHHQEGNEKMVDIQVIVDKILSDQEFCVALAQSPAAALEQYAIQASAEVVAALQGLDAVALTELADAFARTMATI
jgi:hypothetical protein